MDKDRERVNERIIVMHIYAWKEICMWRELELCREGER